MSIALRTRISLFLTIVFILLTMLIVSLLVIYAVNAAGIWHALLTWRPDVVGRRF